ncbi:MAG: chemotaxis protein CheC [Magnetococcales bacterium]|nr:chemotaxis protein CheC [Magnetococcales bacterium]
MFILTPQEQDALQELLNVGFGRAGASLSEMLDEEVILSLPFLDFLPPEEAIDLMEKSASGDEMAAVRQVFTGSFSGTAMLVYGMESSLNLVRALLKEDLPASNLTELERESLLEVGNILLNACLGTLANMLEGELECHFPEYLQRSCRDLIMPLFGASEENPTSLLFLVVQFRTTTTHIQGYLVLLLGLDALRNLRQQLARLLERFE